MNEIVGNQRAVGGARDTEVRDTEVRDTEVRSPIDASRPLPDPFDRLTDRFFQLAGRYARFGLSHPEHQRLLRLARIIAAWFRVHPEDVLDEALLAAEEEESAEEDSP